MHVLGPGGVEFRINLQDGSFMDPVPKGRTREVKRIFRKHVEQLRRAWERYHPTRKVGGETK